MAFTEKQLPYARQKYLTFFATGGSAANTNSTLIEFIAFSQAFELEKIRIRLSLAHISVVDFMVYLSNHLGSYYNHNFVSQAMLALQDHVTQFDPTLKFHPGDTIHCSMIYSAANHYGLEISGWAITVPSGG